ncbi:hypothetical protein E9840_03685 [Tissierella creatinini]|nr:hypothetical protein E9840_03685 [Tissierella creatinini]
MIVFSKQEEEMRGSKIVASAILMLAVIGLWMTVGIHGISEWLVAFVAVIIMYGMKILKKEDLKEVNPRFLEHGKVYISVSSMALGFRPIRSCHDALKKIYMEIWEDLKILTNYYIIC